MRTSGLKKSEDKVTKEKLYLGEVEEDGGKTKNNSLLLVW